MVQVVDAAAVWSAAAWPSLWRASDGLCGCCGARARDLGRLGSGRAVVMWSGSPAEQARAWIEALTGEAFSDPGNMHASLKDGVLLCKTINAIVPGTIPARAINASKMPFKQVRSRPKTSVW